VGSEMCIRDRTGVDLLVDALVEAKARVVFGIGLA
jgi:hypothetical protein